MKTDAYDTINVTADPSLGDCMEVFPCLHLTICYIVISLNISSDIGIYINFMHHYSDISDIEKYVNLMPQYSYITCQ